jgi:hypothetical protein
VAFLCVVIAVKTWRSTRLRVTRIKHEDNSHTSHSSITKRHTYWPTVWLSSCRCLYQVFMKHPSGLELMFVLLRFSKQLPWWAFQIQVTASLSLSDLWCRNRLNGVWFSHQGWTRRRSKYFRLCWSLLESYFIILDQFEAFVEQMLRRRQYRFSVDSGSSGKRRV